MTWTSISNKGDHYVAVINLDHEHRQNKHLMKTNKPFRCRRCLCILVAKQAFADTTLLTACKYNDFNLPNSKSRYQRLPSWATWHARVIVSCGCIGWFGYHQVSQNDVFDAAARSVPTAPRLAPLDTTNYLQGATVKEKQAKMPRQTSPAGINLAADR